MNRKFAFFSVFLIFSFVFLFAESEGEKAFRTNKPEQAIPLLEKDISTGNISSDTHNFLGLAYFQTGDYKRAIDTFEKGLTTVGTNKKLLYYNEGNVAYASGDFGRAENCFSFAYTADPTFFDALLNRANTRLSMKKYKECVPDYKKFIEELPDDPQADNIRKLIAYLEEEIVRQEEEAARIEAERLRMEEENRRLQEELERQEQERLAKEAAEKAAEEERRRRLLEEVANSLQQTDTTNMTAGAEDVLDYEYESELE